MRRVLWAALLVLAPLFLAAPANADANITVTADPSYATEVPTVETYDATGVTNNEATLHSNVTNNGGGTITMRGFEWGIETGNYTSSWNETGSFTTGTFNHEVTTLPFCTPIFWRAFAVNDYGQGNSTELDFSTSCYPGPPTNFTMAKTFPNSITITWTMGVFADTTIIRASADGYPSSVTDGYEIYSSNGTSVTIDGFAFDISACYVRAWSHNDYGYSVDYAEGSIGSPIGLPAITFAIGLCGFALWRRDWVRVLLAICIIMWGAFAMPYEVKVAAPLVAVGSVLFFMGITYVMQAQRQEEA